jgi:branched-subunit amino acid ABC-type transport system permease component
MDLNLLLQLTLNGVIVGALYGVVAMSFVLIYKASQVVNFAQGEFLLVGAWVCWWFLTTWQLPFIVGFLFTLAFMTVFGLVLQVVVLRPLIGEPVISVIMATIGLGIFFQALMKWMFGVFAQPFRRSSPRRVSVMGLEVQTVYLVSLAISLVIMGAFAWFFTASKHGLAMRATAFDQQVAQSLGRFRPPRLRHVLGNLGRGLGGRGRRCRRGERRLLGAVLLRHQGVPGGDPGRARQRAGRGSGRADRRAAGELGALRGQPVA